MSYTRARAAIHRIRILRYCLSACHPHLSFLSQHSSASLPLHPSLFQSIHSQLANAALFSPSASSHTIRIFPSSRLLLQSLSIPQHSFVSLSSFSSTAPVPCRAPFLAVCRLPPSSVYSHSTTQASIASATYTHTLSSYNPSTFGGIRHHHSRWTLPNCNSLATNQLSSLCASSCTSSQQHCCCCCCSNLLRSPAHELCWIKRKTALQLKHSIPRTVSRQIQTPPRSRFGTQPGTKGPAPFPTGFFFLDARINRTVTRWKHNGVLHRTPRTNDG